MKKFYKTAYSRSQVPKNNENTPFKPFLCKPKQNVQLHQISQDNNLLNQRQQINKKIQIDPSILFTYKVPKNQGRLISEHSKTKASEKMYFTSTQGFNYHQERPQSKQQSRAQNWSRANSAKKQYRYQNRQRPQTSKGVRKIHLQQAVNRRKQTENENFISEDIPIKLSTTKNKDLKGQRKHSFQTSLDAQFLSLFAS